MMPHCHRPPSRINWGVVALIAFPAAILIGWLYVIIHFIAKFW